MPPVCTARGYSYAYPGEDHRALSDVCLEVRPGECHCFTGPTGSGKSTLLLALAGLLPEGEAQGSIEVARPRIHEGSTGIGVVLQNPQTQLLGASVGGEVAFGLENLGMEPREMPRRVQEALAAVGLAEDLDVPVGKLSTGEQYRLLVAAALITQPRVLALDEPSCQLDPVGLAQLRETLQRLKGTGIAVLLCEHDPAPLGSVIDHHWRVAHGGRVLPNPREVSKAEPRTTAPRDVRDAAPEVLRVDGLSVSNDRGESLWTGLSWTLRAGEWLGLTGPNGCGKTTLLRCLAGFHRPTEGQVSVFGEPPTPAALRGRLGCLFQNPQRQLFEETVAAEVGFPLRRLHGCEGGLEDATRAVLSRFDLTELAARSPHKLSFGQQHVVALASVLAPRPQVVLLDDPFAGLDRDWQEQIASALRGWSMETGAAVVRTAHHPLSEAAGHRVLCWSEAGWRFGGDRGGGEEIHGPAH